MQTAILLTPKKVCPSCGKERHLSDFHKSSKRPFGVAVHCKDCKKTRYPHNYAQRKIVHIRHRYGLEIEEYEKLYKEQGAKCAICSKDFTKCFAKDINVDHNHKTGKTRGLLCHNCNVGLGHFSDNTKTLKQAMSYITKHNE